MQSRFDVWATVQDTGETAGMLPVVRELCREGLSVQLLAAGRALEMFRSTPDLAPCGYWDATHPMRLADEHPSPRMLFATTANGGGAGRDLIPRLRGASTTVLLQSLWGGLAGWGQEHQPDYVITNDRIGLRTVSSLWPALQPEAVLQTGFPMLDAYASIDIKNESAAARKALGLDERPLVFFAGQAAPTGYVLSELVAVLNGAGGDFYFLPRPHPSTKADFPFEIGPWQQALARFRGHLVVDYFGACTTQQLVAAACESGVVVDMYSTVLLEVAAARARAVAALYPEALQSFRDANPGLSQFPLVELGCAALATDRASLKQCLRVALGGNNPQRSQQEACICVDGQNASRAVQGILRLPVFI